MTTATEASDIALLDDPQRWAEATARLLADLGFSLINSDRPGAPGGSNLLVAFRDRPTLRHFDPEQMSYWVSRQGRGRTVVFDRSREAPMELVAAWGSVRITDRLSVDNRFLTFGGTLRIAAIDPSLVVAALHSPGPIVRWGGHSQGTDPLAGEIGAFFGRLMVPVDFEAGAEQRLAVTPAAVLYAAFVRQARYRLAASASYRRAEPQLERWLMAVAGRIARQAPVVANAGATLLADLGLPGA